MLHVKFNLNRFVALTAVLMVGLAGMFMARAGARPASTAVASSMAPTAVAARSGAIRHATLHKTINVDGLDIFYREAGPANAATILLLHGFPTSSQMFGNLIPALSDQFHLVAPDYHGFGNSSMPTVDEFEYTFDHFADVMEGFIQKLGLKQYSLYVMDTGRRLGIAWQSITRRESRL